MAPIDEPEPDAAARLARLRTGLPDERELLDSLGDVLRELRRAATEDEEQFDVDAGWERVQGLLAEESPPEPT